MPQFPESLDPKGRKAESGVQIEWQTVSYRTVALIAMVVAVAAGTVVYFLYPDKVRSAVNRLLSSSGGGTVKSNVLQRQAQFLNIEGNVRVKKANAIGWVAASPNLPLEKGDVVQASGDGVARISFADGAVYTVRPDTLIVVEENSGMADSKSTTVSVQVTSGEVDLATTKFEGVSKVVFANAEARIGQDSRAKVRSDPNGRTSEFTMAQGSSEVLRGSERVTLGSYEQVSFSHDASKMSRQRVMGPPLLLIPANNAPVISSDGGKTEVSFSWTPVPTARQYRLRISSSPIFTTLAFDRRVPSSTAKVPGLPEGTYYWAVSSLDDKSQESQTSDASKFILQKTKDEILLELDNFIQHGKVYQIVGRTEPGARIMVNDEPVFTVQPDGSFKHFTQPFPSPGANQITVTAQNAKGQIATRRKTVYIQ